MKSLTTVKHWIKKVPGARTVARALGLAGRQAPATDEMDAQNRDFLFDMLPRNAVCAEIGVHEGDFSHLILKKARPAEFHLIDPWRYEASDTYKTAYYGGAIGGNQAAMDERYQSVCARFQQAVAAGCVKIHRGNSADVLAEFPDEYFDWIYIDGNHMYDYVMKDLELSFRKTKRGGYILGDDYGVKGWWWNDDIERAVDDFAKADPTRNLEIRATQFIFRKG